MALTLRARSTLRSVKPADSGFGVVTRSTSKLPARGHTAPEAVPGPRDFSTSGCLEDGPLTHSSYLPHGDRSMQAVAGMVVVLLILLVALPLYALLG